PPPDACKQRHPPGPRQCRQLPNRRCRSSTAPPKARCETDSGTMAVMEESALAQVGASDVLMPVQYYDGAHRDDPETQAIKRLMFAVLADAVRCLQTYPQSCAGRRVFGEAEWWILDRNSDGPFTFHAICETLGIEPDRLRDGLRQWRMQQFSG